jgi:NADP-dependent 3-hydroxy acid dehydrogenase YdfG
MNSLADHIAVVTGAGSGIGRAIAGALAEQGVFVCLVGRTRKTLEETSGACVARRPPTVLPIDLTLDDQIETLKLCVERQFGQVDVLVHCAGVISKGRLESHSVNEFDSQYRANVRAPYLLTQALLPMLRIRPGQIVVINSSVGLRASGGVSQFSATQHALKAITDSLREEVNSFGIRIVSIFPGRTATPRQAALYSVEGKTYQPELLLQPADIASIVISALSLPRTAEVTDINIRPLAKSY